MSVVPEIKSPLEEKIVVKPILWTMYHIHAYQGPCRYGQGYALTTEADMEVAQKEYNRFLERIHEAVDPKKVEVLDGSLLHWNEDFVIHDNVWEEALAEDEKVDTSSAVCAFPATLLWSWQVVPPKQSPLSPTRHPTLPVMMST